MSTNDPAGTFALHLQRLQEQLQLLPDKPDESPEITLRCLWALAANQPLSISQLGPFAPTQLDDAGMARLRELIDQRLDGTPLAHLTGRQDFMGLVLLSSPAALVPRRETEQLGFSAVHRLKKMALPRPLVIDVCTGAGNVALGVACHLPQARVMGADLSPEAVGLARQNAAFLGRGDVEFRCGDLLEPFDQPDLRGMVDMITCNPPYISSARVDGMAPEISRHEPRLAFDGGPFGVKVIRKLIATAPQLLKPGGWLLMEIGLGQGTGVARSLAGDSGYDEVHTHNDAAGQIRVIEARRSLDSQVQTP
ncbi:MAG: peptide chain release factor N(5)-glutamine methyltransferase [Gammaproteobacteria bacterium]|nr:peptide chain release factor N(5)-glutamine methyltransferase [Gammaproteobacteria bacterium]